MTVFLVISQIIAWGCAVLVWHYATQYPQFAWTARWQTVFTLACLLAFIASPDSFAFYIAISIFVVAIIATYVGLARMLWPLRSTTKRAAARRAAAHVEETVVRLIADGTAYPPRPATEDAKKSLCEGVVNAIGFLQQCHAGEDYVLPGPAGHSHYWHWRRNDEPADRLGNCVVLAQITYTMLYLAAADALGYPLRAGDFFCIDATSINALVAYIAYQRDVAELLVAPMPYSQQEYREALEPPTQAMVLSLLDGV